MTAANTTTAPVISKGLLALFLATIGLALPRLGHNPVAVDAPKDKHGLPKAQLLPKHHFANSSTFTGPGTSGASMTLSNANIVLLNSFKHAETVGTSSPTPATDIPASRVGETQKYLNTTNVTFAMAPAGQVHYVLPHRATRSSAIGTEKLPVLESVPARFRPGSSTRQAPGSSQTPRTPQKPRTTQTAVKLSSAPSERRSSITPA